MSDAPCAVLGTAYCPPVEYFMAAAAAGSVLIERCGSYVKQTYRNRCRIYSCNGVLSLTVPVLQSGHDRGMSTVAIDYSKPWVQQHKRAIVSAYSTSAFFEYYQDDLFAVLDSRPDCLLDLNSRITEILMRLLGLRCSISFTDSYIKDYGPGFMDLREAIHPKKTVPDVFRDRFKPYYQVFSAKFGFLPGLSALDLLFNEGPNAVSFLL